MKNKGFQDYLRDQEQHHIQRSKKHKSAVDVPTIEVGTATNEAIAAMEIKMVVSEATLRRFTEERYSIDELIARVFGDTWKSYDTAVPWTASIRSTLEGGKKMLRWQAPYGVTTLVEEVYFDYALQRTLFQRYTSESPLTLHDQCRAVGLTLCDRGGVALDEVDVFPVTDLSEMEKNI